MAQQSRTIKDLGLEGMALHQRGDIVGAEKLYQQALKLNPRTLTALNGLAVLRAGEKKYDEAIGLFLRAIAVDPKIPDFHHNLASAYRSKGDNAAAMQPLLETVRLNPAHLTARVDLARLYDRQGDKEQAETHYRAALAIQPEQIESLVNLGEILREQRKLKEAEVLLDKAYALQPDHYGVVNNFGMLRQTQNRLLEAADLFRRVTQLKPDFLEGHNNLAVALQDLGDYDGAIAAYEAVAKLDQDYLLGLYNKALCMLTYGKLAEGFDAWAARHRLKNKRNFPQPLWDGSNLCGKRVLIWGDQGLGEDILTFSTVDDLLAQGAQVMVELPDRLIPLFQRTYPQVEFIVKPPMPDADSIRDDLTDPRALDRAIDFQCPTFWPAVYLRRNFSAFPLQRQSFLQADPDKTKTVRARYTALGKKRIIGIAWRSGAKLGRYKSSQLFDWLPILQTPDTVFIDLQYGDTQAERAAFAKAHPDILIYHDDQINQMKSIEDFAAQIAACDCIVSISNTTVHIAGAIGKPCHLMLPQGLGSLWYWFRERSDNPWYPSLKLYRQTAVGAWSDTVQSVTIAVDNSSQMTC